MHVRVPARGMKQLAISLSMQKQMALDCSHSAATLSKVAGGPHRNRNKPATISTPCVTAPGSASWTSANQDPLPANSLEASVRTTGPPARPTSQIRWSSDMSRADPEHEHAWCCWLNAELCNQATPLHIPTNLLVP